MKKKTIYPILLSMAAVLSMISCVKDDLFNTPHPDKGAVVITPTWESALEETDIPDRYRIFADEVETTDKALHTPGRHTLFVYNEPEGIQVDRHIATLTQGADGKLCSMPGFLFSQTMEIDVPQDDTLRVEIPMKSRICPVSVLVRLEGDNLEGVELITSTLDGIAGSVNIYQSQLAEDGRHVCGRIFMEDWGLKRFLKAGYRTLFYGPPGTGKTLAATLLGKKNGMDVYRVDLSMIVSKYIGETEKNLAKVFDLAENRNWILFFDEADALFGKRTSTNTSNDRHANQEVGYLLQRIEDFPGMVILATNLKSNIDEAFSRRFQSVIYFPMPDEELRRELWHKMLPEAWLGDDSGKLLDTAARAELSGGSIANVVRRCAISLINVKSGQLDADTLKTALEKEVEIL